MTDFDMNEYINWALSTFPDETLSQQATHLLKETKELEAQPNSLEEAVDVAFLCALIGHRAVCLARDSGHYWEDFLAACRAKLDKNKGRRWVRTPDGDYQHVED